MTLTVIAFYIFATVAVASGLLTVLARNPVHSVLWLILAFFSAAGMMVLIGAEFVAMLLVIVYVGAVMVLFLFVVMMLDVDFAALKEGLAKFMPIGLVMGVILLMELALVFGHWIIADGVEGYLSQRLDKYGKPVCSGAAPANTAIGPYKSGSSVPDPI